MTKSRHVFLIFSFIYIGIAIGGMFSLLTISDNVLLGLSISSLFISLADAINNYDSVKKWKNDYNFSLLLSSEYLQRKIDNGYSSIGNFDIYNIKYNIEVLMTKSNPIHPVEYAKKTRFKVLDIISTIFFTIGIASFIVVPFFKSEIGYNISRYITVLAFSFVCGNLFLCDIEKDIMQKNYSFMNDKQSLISAVFPEYMNEFAFRTQHLAAYTEMKKTNMTAGTENQQ